MSLQNYLKSLEFSDHYDNDVLRFIALWLEFANLNLANSTVEANLSRVPSGKLVPIMNQLSSRLQSDGSHFQKLLADLVFRICKDHPYHGMYQVNSGTSSAGIRDEAAKSRQAAANKVSALLKADSKAGTYWKIIRYANGLYHDAAVYRDKDEFQAGKDYPLEQYAVTQDLAKKIPTLRVPPATIHIDVRGDCNYKKVPTIAHFKPKMKIASGLSAPKIITAVATNGKSYKQLVRCGNRYYPELS